MTKKESKKETETQEAKEKQAKKIEVTKMTESEAKKDLIKETKPEKQDIKLLECEDQKILEYFSKDDLCKKVKELEQNSKEQREKLEKLKTESIDWKNKYMRLQAEFENAQKRWDKNRLNLRLEYTAGVIKSFLPLYDSFKKALSDDNSEMKILKGFYDQFMNIFKSYKAEPILTKVNEPFDYNYHEALSSIERTDVPNNTIIDVIQDGWKLDKEVIRYTKVIISKEPKPPEPEVVKDEQIEQIENDQSGEISLKSEDHKESTKPVDQGTKPENEYVG